MRPQRDGVHIQVDNRADAGLLFDVSLPEGGGGGGSVPPGVSQVEAPTGGSAWPAPPGVVKVRCLQANQDVGDDSGYVSLRVVDEEGLWVSTELECEGGGGVGAGISDYVEGARGEVGDPVEIAKRNLAQRLRPGDVVELAGYPEGLLPVVRVVHDGRVVATVEYRGDGKGGWLTETESMCSDWPRG